MDWTSESHVEYVSGVFAECIQFSMGTTMKCQACPQSSHIFAMVPVCFRCCRELDRVGQPEETSVDKKLSHVSYPEETSVDKKLSHVSGADNSPSPPHNDS